MICFKCRAELSKGLVNHVADINGRIIIIKGVPADVCNQCGDYMVDDDVAIVLEKIINDIKNSKVEVSIINFNDVA